MFTLFALYESGSSCGILVCNYTNRREPHYGRKKRAFRQVISIVDGAKPTIWPRAATTKYFTRLFHYQGDRRGRSNLKKRIAYFLGAKRIDGLSTKTLENYRFTLNIFAAQVNKHVAKITTDDLRAYISYLSEERSRPAGPMTTRTHNKKKPPTPETEPGAFPIYFDLHFDLHFFCIWVFFLVFLWKIQ